MRASIMTLLLELYVLNTWALVTHHSYVRNSQFDGYTCASDDTVESFDNVRTKVACVVRCVEHGWLDVFYHPDSKQCLGCYTIHSGDLHPSGTTGGSVYYTPDLDCPRSFVRYNTSCYKVTNSKMTWNSAKNLCASENAYLAIIEESAENYFIGTWLENAGVGSSEDRVYFGLTDSREEATWRTVNGDIQSYTNWNDGQPSSGLGIFGLMNEDCAAINMKTTSKKWNDISCDESHFAVCEKELF